MKTNFKWFLALATALVLAAVSAGAQELQLHGRVSYDTKGMLVKGTDDKDWERATLNTLLMPGDALWVDQGGLSEVELAGGSFLRLADGSKAELQSLPPAANIRGWVGSIYVQRVSRSQGSFLLTTPSCLVDIPIDSCVRVDVDEKGGATVSVRWGGAEVRTDQGSPVRLGEAQRLWVDPGYLPSDPVNFDRGESDAFDQWNNERAAVLANGFKTLPKEVEIAAPVVGVSDLGTYGEWVYVDSRPCWRPTVVVDYVPYRYGCWNYCPAVGSVWVGAYPFCYVTSHYGRWSHAAAYGWVWSYDPVWSPAWATTVCAGDYLMWAPMGWDCRPVMVTESAYFGVGGVSFCVSSTSWMPMTYVTTGWAPVSPCTPVFVDSVCMLPPAQINVWNIYVDNDHHHHDRPHPTPYDTNVFRVRDYNPPRSIRGVAAPSDGPPPGERAHALETRMGRNSFSSVERTGSHMERSAASRGSSMRSVRLENATALQPDTAPGLAELRRSRPTGGTATNPEARRAPDGGTPTLTNESATGVRTGNLRRSVPAVREGMPADGGETGTPLRGESRTMTGAQDRSDAGAGAERTVPRGVSGRGTMRDIEPGSPAPSSAARSQSIPGKTPVRGSVREVSGESSSYSPDSRSGFESGRKPVTRGSEPPSYTSTRGSRPLSFDTDASRVTAPRGTSSRIDSSTTRVPTTTPRIQTPSTRSFETPSTSMQRSEPMTTQPRFEAPAPQPRFDRSAPVSQPRFETPRVETPQPRFDRAPVPQPRFEAPRIETPQPRFEAPRVATPRIETPRISTPSVSSISSRSGSLDSGSVSGGSSSMRSVRGR